MRSIFLSASIPNPTRHPRYYETMDVIAIRDSVRALATVALPSACLFWGGHPSITPLIRVVAESVGITGGPHVRLFQSAWFSDVLPDDNAAFEEYTLTEKGATLDESISIMRRHMLGSARFDAAVFIGGMEGIEVEFDLFREYHPNAPVFPIASTGAAAKLLYERHGEALDLPPELETSFTYPTLFRSLLALSAS